MDQEHCDAASKDHLKQECKRVRCIQAKRVQRRPNKLHRLFSQLILKLSKLDATFSAVSIGKTKKKKTIQNGQFLINLES